MAYQPFPYVLLNGYTLRCFDIFFIAYDDANISRAQQRPLKMLISRLVLRLLTPAQFFAQWAASTGHALGPRLQAEIAAAHADVGPHYRPLPLPLDGPAPIDHIIITETCRAFFTTLDDDNPHIPRHLIKNLIRQLYDAVITPQEFLSSLRAIPNIHIREYTIPTLTQLREGMYESVRARMARCTDWARLHAIQGPASQIAHAE